MLQETRAAIQAAPMTLCPPTPPGKDTIDESEHSPPAPSLDEEVICPSCSEIDPGVFISDGHAFCALCDGRVSALDVPPGDHKEAEHDCP